MALGRTSWRRRPLLALIILILILLVGYAVRAVNDHSKSIPSPNEGRPASSVSVAAGVPLSGLPKEVSDTVRLIRQGGPFRYSQDGVTYNNLERQLPAKPRGYYHEYTVTMPGSSDRGARRIVTGRDGQYYYTANHYQSFVQVRTGN